MEREKREEEFMPVSEKSPEEVQAEMDAYMTEDHTGRQKRKGKKWSKKRKLILAGAVFLVGFAMVKIASGGQKEVIPFVMTTPLEKGDVKAILTLNGPVSGTASADVVSNLHAEVLAIAVKEGDRVTKGQVLATIDSTDMKKAVEIAKNSYDLAVSEHEKSIRDTKSDYEKALQDYNAAKLSHDRNQVLFNAGDIPSTELEAAENTMRDAKRTVDSFTVENGRVVPDKSYELKVKSALYELEQKQTDLENTEVKSPIDGTVVRVNSKVGQFADKPEDDKPMFIVEDLDNLEMEIAVSEYSIGKVKKGQRAEIRADIMGEKSAEGEVVSISPTGEEKGGSTERIVPTTIRIIQKDSGLIAGITARASIETGEAIDVFKVPQTALVANPDGTTGIATVSQTDSTIHMIAVKVGIESDLEAEIIPVTEGELTEGVPVIMAPAGLTEGTKVTHN